ncbi:MAG: SMP-30/gluconolactonase/LRE family protein [Edaphobacter sp.]
MRRLIFFLLAGLLLVGATPGAQAADIQIVAKNLHFLEGAIFVGDTLYFVDYTTSDVFRLSANTVERVWHEDGCGANGLLQWNSSLLVACFDDGTIVNISLKGKHLKTFQKDAANHHFVCPNDLAADAKGGVYFTASGLDGTVPGKVFHIAADGIIKEIASGINYSNGLVVSSDGKLLYIAESRLHRLLVYTIASDGTLGPQREFSKLDALLADGRHKAFTPGSVRIDSHGNLFIALFDGGGLAVISPDGKLLKRVDLPDQHHTSLAISPDGRSIYITALDANQDQGLIYRLPNPMLP